MDITDIREIVGLHQQEIFRFVRFLGAKRDVAEDVVQDTFLNALKSKKLLEFKDVNSRRSWLRGISRNVFLMHCRKARRSPVKITSKALQYAEEIWASKFLRNGDGFDFLEALRTCLESLPEKMHGVIEMRYRHKNSILEIASALDMSVDGINSLLRRTKERLRECVNRRIATGEV